MFGPRRVSPRSGRPFPAAASAPSAAALKRPLTCG